MTLDPLSAPATLAELVEFQTGAVVSQIRPNLRVS